MKDSTAVYMDLDLEERGEQLIELSSMQSHSGLEEEDDEGDDSLNEYSQHESETRTSTQNYHGVLQVVVPNEQRHFYEKIWVPKIFQKLATMRGFRNRYVEARSSNDDNTEYVVVLIFDTYDNFRTWETSIELRDCLAELSGKHIIRTQVNAYGGSVEPADLSFTKTSNRISLHNCIKKVPRALPPPKWKLALLIASEVYIALVFVTFSGSVDAMLGADIPLGLVLFLSISHTVILLVYAGLPLLMSVPVVNQWLRLRRRCNPSEMHPLHAVLDQGLQIFAVKLKPKDVPQYILDKMSKMEARLDKLLAMNQHLQEEVNQFTSKTDSTTALKKKEDPNNQERPVVDALENHMSRIESRPETLDDQTTGEREKPLTMACKHFVKWEHKLDFENWSKEMDSEMKKFNGYEGMITIAPKVDGDPFVNSFTFSTFDDLMEFTRSNGRKELLSKLNPMLEAASEIQMAKERHISDAFTELCVPTGGKAETRPPPLWKTTILTIIPLHIVVWQGGTNIKPYITRHVALNDFLLLFLLTLFNVFVNSYVGLPLMLSQFGDWLHMPRSTERSSKSLFSLNFLDEGLSFPCKVLLVVVYITVNLLLGFM